MEDFDPSTEQQPQESEEQQEDESTKDAADEEEYETVGDVVTELNALPWHGNLFHVYFTLVCLSVRNSLCSHQKEKTTDGAEIVGVFFNHHLRDVGCETFDLLAMPCMF